MPKLTFLLPVLASLGAPAQAKNDASGNEYDLVILNGRVLDPESGTDAVRNVGIQGRSIEAITTEPISGRKRINAKGLVVAPGFIDLHQHGQDAASYKIKAADGVTTALELEVGTSDVDKWYAERAGKALINYGASIGHIQVRMRVLNQPGDFVPPSTSDAAKREATPKELAAILEGIEAGLKRGALAVGFGPAYTPGATQYEILEAFRVAARYGAFCDIHVRSIPGHVSAGLPGFEEAIAASVIAGAPVHIAHVQSTGGPTDTPIELKMAADARSHGVDVTVEAYPYTHGMTSIQAALFDHREDEPKDFFSSLLWPATGEHLTRETFLKYRKSGGLVVIPCNTDAVVAKTIADPQVIIASDGILSNGAGHPRNAGTYSRVLGRYVRQEHALSLTDAIRKMSLMPAQRLEKRAPMMKNKGRVRVGADADLAIFDPKTVLDRATYQQPTLPPVGMKYVLVGGTPVVLNGKVQDGAPGQAVRAPF